MPNLISPAGEVQRRGSDTAGTGMVARSGARPGEPGYSQEQTAASGRPARAYTHGPDNDNFTVALWLSRRVLP